ncbi:MAG: amidohydrolase family protein [Bradymonadales bacterium]
MDIWIKNAKLRSEKNLQNIGIKDGKIAKISENVSDLQAKILIDAKGNLVTESYCNPHLHLCKVWTLAMQDEAALSDYHGADMGKAMTAIESAARVKSQYKQDWIVENATKAAKLAAKYGNLHIRAFADVDPKARLEGVKALLEVRDKFKGIVNIEVVAFPQDGVIRDPGAEELVEEAVKLGADVVGGIPWIEYTNEDELAHINKMMDIAQKYNKKVSMLVDDAGDPTLKTLEMLATQTIKRKMQGKVLAQHARAMQLYPQPYFQKLAALLKIADIAVVSDPQTGPLHARVEELLAAGNTVCLGQDDISDAYYPYGRNNMLEVAFLASHLLWMTSAAKIEKLYDMITLLGAKAMGIESYALAEGNDAALVVLHDDNVLDALRNHSAPRYVISSGKVIAESYETTEYHV